MYRGVCLCVRFDQSCMEGLTCIRCHDTKNMVHRESLAVLRHDGHHDSVFIPLMPPRLRDSSSQAQPRKCFDALPMTRLLAIAHRQPFQALSEVLLPLPLSA